MSSLPAPEPQPVDEENATRLQHLVNDNALRFSPYGDDRCRNCLYYLDTDSEASYCWQPKIRLMVDEDWWCQWWEAQD